MVKWAKIFILLQLTLQHCFGFVTRAPFLFISLYFRTYTHTCANIETCAMIGDYFSPSTIKNVPLFDHSHTQTCTKVNKALKHVG